MGFHGAIDIQLLDLIIGVGAPLLAYFFLIRKDFKQALVFTGLVMLFIQTFKVLNDVFDFKLLNTFDSLGSFTGIIVALIVVFASVLLAGFVAGKKLELKDSGIITGIIVGSYYLVFNIFQILTESEFINLAFSII